MGLKLGNIDINKLYKGSTPVNKMYLGSQVLYDNVESSTEIELLTESNAAAKENEGNSLGSWTSPYNITVETTDVDMGSYAIKAQGAAGGFILSRLNFTGEIGDSITFSFKAKCNTQNEQNINLGGTSDNNSFFVNGSQPTTYTEFTRTVILTSTNFYIQIGSSFGGGLAEDYLLIDELSILKNIPVESNRPRLVDSYSETSTGLSITLNATPTSGNYLIAQLALGNYSSDPVAPVGWEKVHETVNSFGAHAFFVKESDGSETSVTFSKTGGEGQIFLASIHEFSNINDTSFYESLQGSARSQSSTISIPSITSTNSNSLAISLVSTLSINEVDDSISSLPSNYDISHQYSSNSGQGAWNILLTQECEEETLSSDTVSFTDSGIYSVLSMVLNPPAQNYYTYSNAAGDDTDTTTGWPTTSTFFVNSVASTDNSLADNYAIQIETRNDGSPTASLTHDISGLTVGQTYKMIVRCKNTVAEGNASSVFFNWNNVSSTTYNGNVIGTDWEEVEILFTAEAQTIGMKIYPHYNSTERTTGDLLEISLIKIE